MSIFDSIKDLVSSFGGEEIVNKVTEQLPVENVTAITDQLGEQAGPIGEQASAVGEQATQKIEDLKNSIGQ